MKILTSETIREADAYIIKNEPIASIDLMERAANQLFNWIHSAFPDSRFVIFAGLGNNGGDALALARMLTKNGNKVRVFEVNFTNNRSQDYIINYERLKKLQVKINKISDIKAFPKLIDDEIIIDGILGSGLNRPAKGLVAEIIHKINATDYPVISIDMPSGLFGEDNADNIDSNIIQACYTLTFQFPKLSFLFPENEIYVGDWDILDIGLHSEFIENVDTPYSFINIETIKPFIISRSHFSHKGDFGHGLLISGSYGKMGACVLASKAALRSGIGLLTTHIPKIGYDILQSAVPEAMVSIDNNTMVFTSLPEISPYNAIGIGPGIGTNPASFDAFQSLLKKEFPLIIDADGINIIANNKSWIKNIPHNSILTPHPKEFDRLVGTSKNSYHRLQKQIEFSKKTKMIVVLKGHFTSVSLPDGSVYFNTTGNPGMATGGSGDVLTGIILGLSAQGFLPDEAALTGVFVHGLAGDLAANELTQSALIASDIIDYLPDAFKQIEEYE